MTRLRYLVLLMVLALMLGVANAKRQAFWIINAEGPDVTPRNLYPQQNQGTILIRHPRHHQQHFRQNHRGTANNYHF